MGSQPPFRMPCSAVAGKPLFFLGGAFQHALTAQLADKYVNVTVVDNWNTDVGGTIPPYERWTPDASGGDSCEVHHCVSEGAPCTPWARPYIANTFSHTEGDKVNFAVEKKRGFKNAMGRRSWHGVLPWTAGEAGCPTNLCADGSGYQIYQPAPTQTKYLTLTVDAHFEMLWDDTDGVTMNHITSAISGARAVNANTGEITSMLSSSEDDENYPDPLGGTGPHVQTYHAENGAGWRLEDNGTSEGVVVYYNRDLGTNIDGVSATDAHCGHVVVPANPFFGGGLSLTELITNWNVINSGDPSKQFSIPTDPNGYDETVAYDVTNGDGSITHMSYHISWARTETSYSWNVEFSRSISGALSGNPETQTVSFSGSLTLSNANTSASVLSDIKSNLLSLWPLNDDKLYPWRTDLKISIAPLVIRSERVNVSPLGFNPYQVDDLEHPVDDANGHAPFSPDWTPTYALRAWFDADCYQWTFGPGTDSSTAAATGLQLLFDGSIIGAPKPAGYQNYFAFNFEDWRGCCFHPPDNPGFNKWSWYQLGWGMDVTTFNTNTGCQLPLNATYWNNWFESVNKPQGAWIIQGDGGRQYYATGCISSDAPSGAGDAAQIVACKYAEILDGWHSQNFALPAGDMKFFLDELHVFCANNASGLGAGSTWALTDATTGTAPPDTTDFSGIWGGPVVGGFYEVSSYSSGVLTLGSKVYDVPANWTSKSNGDDAFCFGKLRWPDESSLLGREAITSDEAGLNFTFSSARPAFGMNSATHQEQVDFWDASMMLISANITATRIDDTHFTIDPGSAAVSAAWITIHNTPKWYLNDTDPKGDYAVLMFASDFRTPGEYERLSSVADCDGNPVHVPIANAGGGPPTLPYASFTQTPGCLPFTPCSPRVVCLSPNGETWNNGVTYDFPELFIADEQYGAKWWGYVQATMTDLYWQPPHRPCNIEPCAQWVEHGADCKEDVEGACEGDEDFDGTKPVYYYAQRPQVEARLTTPCNYGLAQNECASVPSSVQIGWSSPVFHAADDGDVAFPPAPPGVAQDEGVPNSATTSWNLHDLLCAATADSCRFNYSAPRC